ncbi:MAG: DUF1189 domain-containing protein [Candidatus Obscuribacterales bacterium]|nr:DUF1189 domain-containing protein [Candidatus Obscuribacterales bacterium]
MSDTNSRKYLLLEGLTSSFADPAFYKSVARDWHGLGLRYLVILSVVFSTVFVTTEYVKVMTVLASPETESMFKSMPVLKVRNGVFSTVDGNVREFKLASSNNVLVVLDPKDTIPAAASSASTAPVMLQSKSFILNLSGRKPLSLFYPLFVRDKELTGSGLLEQLKNLANAVLIPLFLAVYCYNFLWVLSRSLVVALFAKLFKTSHSFATSTRLVVAASTPSVLVAALVFWLQIHLGKFESPLFATIFFVYVTLAFRWCRD